MQSGVDIQKALALHMPKPQMPVVQNRKGALRYAAGFMEEAAVKLQEFRSKKLLARYGVGVPRGRVVLTAQDARSAAAELDSPGYVVKAQIVAGGRGHAGGVAIVPSPEAVETKAAELLGGVLVTDQTGPVGYPVRRVLVEEVVKAPRSLYLALAIDAANARIVILAGGEGGVEIEDRLESGQVGLSQLPVSLDAELSPVDVAALAPNLGLEDSAHESFAGLLSQLHKAFVELDATLIELNPLALTTAGEFIPLDAKIVIDDSALFRHLDLMALRDEEDSDDVEFFAQSHQLNYVKMDGDIGIAVNGAGLGLATLDMVCAADGRPANFMDIRTTATSLDVAHGFTLLLENPAVRAILINVHGGGMQPCDTIADGLGIAMRRTGLSRPTIARLAGNNAEYARFRLKNFGCEVIDCPDMWSAVTQAVAAAQAPGGRP